MTSIKGVIPVSNNKNSYKAYFKILFRKVICALSIYACHCLLSSIGNYWFLSFAGPVGGEKNCILIHLIATEI